MSLVKIQARLKAHKGQRNSFGNYNYRSLEDIMEAVKPLLDEYGYHLIIGDDIQLVGDRYYVKATARLYDGDNVVAENTAFARESANKKGMDDSQVTGATSSYARKYCLNGLFCIDDTKDADTWDNSDKKATVKKKSEPKPEPETQEQKNTLTFEELKRIASVKLNSHDAVLWVNCIIKQVYKVQGWEDLQPHQQRQLYSTVSSKSQEEAKASFNNLRSKGEK